MKLSVCADAFFPGKSLESGLQAMKKTGVDTIEIWEWWSKNLAEFKDVLKQEQIHLAAACTRFVSLTDPACRTAYHEGVLESMAALKPLGCSILISQVGDDTGAPREAQRESIILGLRETAKELESQGFMLVIEPLNQQIDHPGYYLTHAAEAFAIVDAVGSPNIRVLYDIYHQQITEGNILNTLLPNLHRIGHIHAAGVPGRHELKNSELDYPTIFRRLTEAGYGGYVGLEYFPQEEPCAGLAEIARYLY